MKDQADYSKYRCPYAHIEKECGHELHGPEGYADTYSVWCACGFRGPVFCLDPQELGLQAVEAVATDAQQLKAEIAALVTSYDALPGNANLAKWCCKLVEKMRQLSAV